jgi:hypothetical protein
MTCLKRACKGDNALSLQFVTLAEAIALASSQQPPKVFKKRLPIDVKYYLHCHGWVPGTIDTAIEMALKLNTEHDNFITVLGDLGVLLLEADYLVSLIISSAGCQ